MKKYFIFAASALALAGCQNDEFLGEVPGNVKDGASSAINIGGEIGKVTRASHVGADAATMLSNKFIVAGYKGAKSDNGIATTKVFDHYVVKWEANTAGKTDDNTSDWKYVGETPESGLTDLSGKQTIKYWDYSAGQYDFIAFSYGKNTLKTGSNEPSGDNEVMVTKVTPSTATSSAYTIKGTKTALHECYIADLITAYNPAVSGKPGFKDEVKPVFRNLTSKVRVALYETIPGYSVKDVKFYGDGTTTVSDISETSATLFTSGNEANNTFYPQGKATVYFPTVGTANLSKSDYNKAHVSIYGENGSTTQAFGDLNYTNSDDSRLADRVYLAQASYNATYAGVAGNKYYTIVLPNETGTTLTLRVNYTLVANDNSGEEIKVYGATAIVPAIYAQWKSNYAYTYIFKISDNTNGKTGSTDGPEGLYPITFDAIVVDSEELTQSTITTVATPSITTYQKGHDVTKNEYSYLATNGDIYVTVHNVHKDGALANLSSAKLYTITDPKNVGITEANIHDALTIGSSTTEDVTTGRNGIQLTKATLMTNVTAISGADGNNITVTEGTAASFTPSAGTTYAFVYDNTPDGATETYLYTAVTPAKDTNVSGGTYFEDPNGSTSASGTADGKTVYYERITNTGKTYAIKVIKVQ